MHIHFIHKYTLFINVHYITACFGSAFASKLIVKGDRIDVSAVIISMTELTCNDKDVSNALVMSRRELCTFVIEENIFRINVSIIRNLVGKLNRLLT